MHRLVYNSPCVKPYERVYLAIFGKARDLHFDDKFVPCLPKGDVTKSLSDAVLCPRTYEFLKDSIVEDVMSFLRAPAPYVCIYVCAREPAAYVCVCVCVCACVRVCETFSSSY